MKSEGMYLILRSYLENITVIFCLQQNAAEQ